MSNVNQQFSDIKMLICDVDGVLTDGKLYYSNDGIAMKTFHVQDGLGLQLLLKSGIDVAIITACKTDFVKTRFLNLGLTHVYTGIKDKRVAFADLIEKTNVAPKHCAYIGDDIIDLALIKQCGIGITVADGNSIVKEYADYITTQKGGNRAVREICDKLLFSQNKIAALLND